MTEFEIVLIYILGVAQGITWAYVRWAPDTAFKRGVIDGLTLKFLWKRHDTK
jgi:hypothetical protein